MATPHRSILLRFGGPPIKQNSAGLIDRFLGILAIWDHLECSNQKTNGTFTSEAQKVSIIRCGNNVKLVIFQRDIISWWMCPSWFSNSAIWLSKNGDMYIFCFSLSTDKIFQFDTLFIKVSFHYYMRFFHIIVRITIRRCLQSKYITSFTSLCTPLHANIIKVASALFTRPYERLAF